MTSKERVMTSLSWREPDRVPLMVYLTPETRGMLQKHFGQDDVLTPLGIDFRSVNPKYKGRSSPPKTA